ncbi:YveK family protein [Siminovitchia sediminis]|uniref:YveK family protein n=1 Tax=Siminovitchia sediminis TaxID=1274353 RepID=A0ABW4KIK8_9BACI
MNRLNQIYSEDKRVPKEINLKDLYRTVKKRFWIAILLAVFFMGAAWYYTSKNKTVPLFEASTNMVIQADGESRKTMEVIITDISMLEKVIEELRLSTSAQSLANRIVIENIDGSKVMSITVTDTNPNRAADIANTTAAIFQENVPKSIEYEEILLLSKAQVNPTPVNKDNQMMMILGGAILGIFIGIGLTLLLDSLDETVKSERDIETLLGIQVIGSVSKMNKRNVLKKKVKKEKVELRGETIGLK